MFTGLIESVGTVASWQPRGSDARLQLRVQWPDTQADLPTSPTRLGDSVAVNGCCLTVVAVEQDGVAELLSFDLSHETLARTAFDQLATLRRVNVERAMRLGDRLGGHIVTGHVDSVGELVAVSARGDAWDVIYAVPPELQADLVVKGSVTIDGVSLTVNALPPGHVQVTLIPHTVAHTQLLDGDPGKRVHVETDILAKHVRRLLQFATPVQN